MSEETLYGHSMLDAVDRLEEIDGIGPHHEAEEHIHPSKYHSRLSIVWRICDALNELKICSICGNGATSLAKKLAIYAKRGPFPNVSWVTVSQNPNLENIQDGIKETQRRGRGCLLILDGFWWELTRNDFQTFIPYPSPYFRIVFTSRTEEMCKKIGSHQIYHIDFLEDEEAWDLFREVAGKSIVDLDIEETARRIVDECDGFRIVILTIASTLKVKPAYTWKESLKILRNLSQVQVSRLENIYSIENLNKIAISDMETVFSRIRLSFNLLNDNEAQKMFFICCFFPEYSEIAVEDLVLFAKGLEILEKVRSVHQARDRVECIIHKLRNSFFLLDGDGDDFIKVCLICREFGVWMSSKLKHPYVARCENGMKEWPLKRTDYENCCAISFMCKTIEQHPVDLECPNLDLLHLSYGRDSARLPNGIFEGLQNLKVLSLSIPSLLQSLTVLKQLRTLCVTESTLDNRYKKPRPRIGGLLGHKMENLEIFSFSTARPYDDFPKEIGLMHNLRYLRFNRERLKYIPEGVLSKLTKLEELYLPLDFISWGCKEEGGERINASLSELDSLQLTSIRIGVSKGSIVAETLVRNLTRFHVFVGSHVSPDYEFGTCGKSKRSLEVFDVDADDFRVSWISDLVWKSESLRLKQVRNLKSIITCQPKEDGNVDCAQWKKICISDCEELEYLVDGQIPWTSLSQLRSLKLFGLHNLREIWNGIYLSEIEGSCFSNLCEVKIMFCRKLKYAFSLSVAAELTQLQSLHICFCDEMESIFCREQMDDDGNQVATNCNERGNASKGKTKLRDWAVNESIHLKSKLLISLASNSVTRRLFGRGKQPNIITAQKQMEESVGNKYQHDTAKHSIIFSQLETMEFAYMDSLRIFCDGKCSIVLPSLQSLSIFHCNHLEAFSYGSFETPLLEQLLINGNQYSVTKDLNAMMKDIKYYVQQKLIAQVS